MTADPRPATRPRRDAAQLAADDELLGPRSLTWRFSGDRRALLLGPRTGLMQNIHPAVGWGVWQHSQLLSDPWGRLARSVPKVGGVLFDPPAQKTPQWVLAQHPPVKGTDPFGRRYRALDPETFFWTHAMFVEHVMTTAELFIRPLNAADKEQLWQEGRAWWRRYRLPADILPPDYRSFRAYWEETIARGEDNPGARAVLDTINEMPRPDRVPAPVWTAVTRIPLVGVANFRLLNLGAIHPAVRDLLGIRWTRADESRFQALAAGIRRLAPLIPARLRYLSFARAAYARRGLPPGADRSSSR